MISVENQLDLFTGDKVTWAEQRHLKLPVRTPASRAADPETSHAAEAHINSTGSRGKLQAAVAGLVERMPGMTSRELAAGSDIAHESLHKRLPECAFAGRVRKGEPRTCRVTGRQATTWWPA